jgi:hypothetical protein
MDTLLAFSKVLLLPSFFLGPIYSSHVSTLNFTTLIIHFIQQIMQVSHALFATYFTIVDILRLISHFTHLQYFF